MPEQLKISVAYATFRRHEVFDPLVQSRLLMLFARENVHHISTTEVAMNTKNRWISAAIAIAIMSTSIVASGAEPRKVGASDTAAQTRAIGDAIASIAYTKQAVTKYRLNHDGFPASNAEAGISPAAAFASDTVKSVSIGAEGVIDITLTALSGVDDGIIRFRPTLAPESDHGQVQWACTSASYADISDLTTGTCTYTNQP